jgi:hypothetical protein
MKSQEKSTDLHAQISLLMANYCLMSLDAQKNLMLISNAYVKSYPADHPLVMTFVPKPWRLKVLRFFLQNQRYDS